MSFKSILKPDASVLGSLATVGAVYGVYQLSIGSAVQAHATTPNHPAMESSRKKAGYSALALVSTLFLLTKDANLFILGCGTVIAMEVSYRHAIMSDPDSNTMQRPSPYADFAPAQNVVPFPLQGETG
jgi:DNA-binding transcriptional regulator LsrR (DeoR family)